MVTCVVPIITWTDPNGLGAADAQFVRGAMYVEGRGVKRDDKRALYWYEKSAKQGRADPQYNLGVMYEQGRGTEKDFKKAA